MKKGHWVSLPAFENDHLQLANKGKAKTSSSKLLNQPQGDPSRNMRIKTNAHAKNPLDKGQARK
jgi:hypothetical protein